MPITHRRIQYGVGKGSFHCGQFFADGDEGMILQTPCFTYIYDCGGRRALVEPALDQISASCNEHLDMLVLSHFDYDHVGHMPTLMRSFDQVNYVFLPLLTPMEKLALQFEYINMYNGGDHGFDGKDDFNQFLDNPGTWFQDRGAVHVIYINGGEPPETIDLDPTPPTGEGGAEFIAKKRGFLAPSTRLQSGTQMLGDSDDFPLMLPTPSTDTSPWIFRFHTRHAEQQQVQDLITRLAARLRLDLNAPSWGEAKQRVTEAITNYLRIRRRTTHINRPFFDALGTDAANRYSLCMYSGPPSRVQNKIGWMATGDAVLNTTRTGSFNEFANHYRDNVENVMTLQAPHHGSQHNSSPELHRLFNNCLWTSSAHTQPNRYNHPHPAVVNARMLAGCAFFHVNERASFATIPPDAEQHENFAHSHRDDVLLATPGRDYIESITMP